MNAKRIGVLLLALMCLAGTAEAARKKKKKARKLPRIERQVRPSTPAARDSTPEADDAPEADTAPQQQETAAPEAPKAEEGMRLSGTPQAPIFDLFLGGGGYGRTLSFRDDLFGQFYPYRVFPAPMLAVSAEYFPGGHAGKGWYSHIGIIAAFEYGFGLSSTLQDDASRTRYPTQVFGGYGGLKGRLILGPAELFLTFAVGGNDFSFTTPPQTTVFLSTKYLYLRPGIGARFAIYGPLAAFFDLEYLAVLSAGEMASDLFPRGKYNGVNAGGGFAVQFYRGLEVRARFDYRRIGATLSPELGDAYVLGGFLDETFALAVGVALRL